MKVYNVNCQAQLGEISQQHHDANPVFSTNMLSADDSSRSADSAQIGWFGLRVGGHPALSLHSSN